ncbi:hypothetical protein [Mycobacterium sp. TY815]|uniref:hypothetical protein n=1 Tax=Mycobacterium sp. TY815 TaxID=3050581 RepID=UPI00274136E9|nr:hypothetical protein [Mycobacterium sp. TY815]MDP7707393.1 hypothetical protein [Mycobacterium sp. TY815]
MMAGNPGVSGAVSALAGSSSDVNPDLLTAQRVLAELVRGSEESQMLVVWSVSVLRFPLGPQCFVANNVGGGWYLPPKVFLPSTVRLAVNDPALPAGWASHWMGCQFPSKLLVDHFEHVRKSVPRVALSALVTTELFAEPPADFGGDYLAMQYQDALRMVGQAPKLDGGQQHRLTTISADLAQRVQALDRGGDVSDRAAAILTGAVFRAAAQTVDSTGKPLVTVADGRMLEAVHAGTATPAIWAEYDRSADQRDNGDVMWPEGHAPRDNDGSEAARAAIVFYENLFRAGRMIELIQCWKTRPPQLAEIAYCGAMAGFAPVIVSTVAALEQQLSPAPFHR